MPDPWVGQRLDDFARDYQQKARVGRRKKQRGLAVLLLSVAIGMGLQTPSAHEAQWIGEGMPAFHVLYGLIAAIVLIATSKFFGRRLASPEDSPPTHSSSQTPPPTPPL